jgi:hypothetical protein
VRSCSVSKTVGKEQVKAAVTADQEVVKKLRHTRERQKRFSEALAETGNMPAAVRVAGTSPLS